MKRVLFERCSLALVAALMGVAAYGQTKTPDVANMIADPSLEGRLGENGLPPQWRGFFSSDVEAYRAEVVAGGRSGKKSLRVSGDGDFGVVSANHVPLDRGKRYAVRGWAKVEGNQDAAADIKFHYYDADGRYLEQTRVAYVTPAVRGWQFITVADRAETAPKAKFIGMALSLSRKGTAWFDDLELVAFDKRSLPEDFELEYGTMPKLRLLQRRVGVWDTETTLRPSVWAPDGGKTRGVETIRWTLGRHFVRGEKTSQTDNSQSTFMMTYDRRSDTYRAWHFDSNGNFSRGELLGRWDEKSQTITFSGLDGGIAITFQLRFVRDGQIKVSGVWKDKDGKVYLDMQGAATRRAKGLQ